MVALAASAPVVLPEDRSSVLGLRVHRTLIAPMSVTAEQAVFALVYSLQSSFPLLWCEVGLVEALVLVDVHSGAVACAEDVGRVDDLSWWPVVDCGGGLLGVDGDFLPVVVGVLTGAL